MCGSPYVGFSLGGEEKKEEGKRLRGGEGARRAISARTPRSELNFGVAGF